MKKHSTASDKTEKKQSSIIFEGKDLRDSIIPIIDLKGISFRNSVLKRCDFSDRDLSFADFTDADLYQANFTGAKLYSTIFRNSDLTRANFTNSNLYGIKLFDADVTRATFDKFVTEERNAKTRQDYSKASDIYNTIKRSLQNHGEITNAAHYYYRQRVCIRKQYPNHLVRFLEYIFIDLLVGYGEKPIRSIYFSLTVICVFSLIYISLPNINLGAVINNQNHLISAQIIQQNDTLQSISSVFQSLEFSITSFSGANVIDWKLVGIARPIMSIEAFIGVILISIILIGFSRKIIRM